MASLIASASSSSASTHGSWTYHAFLSFRGEDTRKNFTDHLYAALERKGIVTFRDDKCLHQGEVISEELVKAIEESMFAIIVVSTNYASSAWCLDELHKVIECSRSKGLIVVPVFYDVEPSDVRHQKGSFEKAFKKHEDRYGKDCEKIKTWRDALIQVASYSGWDSKDQHEATLVENIAQQIFIKLVPKLPSCIEGLVGIASRVEDVTRLIGIGLNDVRFIGIWGMGGIGKTTLARTIYDVIQGKFTVSCFLANVRENCDAKNGLVKLQEELVAHSHMDKSTRYYFNNHDDGKRMIQISLSNKKVLLILDDVDDVSQLENLAGKKDWFGSGSRVIITTRDTRVLKVHGVYEHDTYEVGCLAQNEALRLFCLKAFKKDEPKEGYVEMSHEVVKYTGSLPLALEVLGSYLHGRDVAVWDSAVKKIKSVSHPKIHDKLKISFEGLDSREKSVFLDIACFFKGWSKSSFIDIISKSCGYDPKIEIDVLVERSLVTIHKSRVGNEYDEILEMHDLLLEMGRKLVIEESPNDPGKRSRLWLDEDIIYVLIHHKGTDAIESIDIHFGYGKQGFSLLISSVAFLNMSMLRLLKISCHVRFDSDLIYLPSSLKVLHWCGCLLKALPLADNEHHELVEIVMIYSFIDQVWQGKKFLEKLQYLRFEVCSELKTIADLSGAPNLREIRVINCSRLTDVHPFLRHLRNLVLLEFWGCDSLKSLGTKLEMSSLQVLILNYCDSLEDLPEFGECMIHLKSLDLRKSAIRELPTSIECLVGLQYLDISSCSKFVRLPDTLNGMKYLKSLRACGCSQISYWGPSELTLPSLEDLDLSHCGLTQASFPYVSWDLPLLKELCLSGNDFVTLPVSFHRLPKLEFLKTYKCPKLNCLPELPSSVRLVMALDCGSLDTSKYSVLSKVTSFYESHSNKGVGMVMSLLTTGDKIPSWFVHKEEGNTVSVSHCPPNNQCLGIALCFLLQWPADTSLLGTVTAKLNGKVSFELPWIVLISQCSLLFTMFWSNGDSMEEFHQDDLCFELSAQYNNEHRDLEINKCGACWISIEDLNKCKSGRPKKKSKVV